MPMGKEILLENLINFLATSESKIHKNYNKFHNKFTIYSEIDLHSFLFRIITSECNFIQERF